jgi:hypothetical protein
MNGVPEGFTKHHVLKVVQSKNPWNSEVGAQSMHSMMNLRGMLDALR